MTAVVQKPFSDQLQAILKEPSDTTREESVMKLAQDYAKAGQAADLSKLTLQAVELFQKTSKAKLGKIVRSCVDLLCSIPGSATIQSDTIKKLVDFATEKNFQFLTLALETKLISVYLDGLHYSDALALIERLLKQLKKMDDKSSLIDVHLLESKCYLQLKNLPKSRAALTSARTSANAIYCPPPLQLQLDIQSGILHAEELDYKTSYSYFYEVVEGANGMNDEKNAVLGLKYMILSKIMVNDSDDVAGIVNGKVAQKYKNSSNDIEAMKAIADASISRSLHSFQQTLNKYPKELQEDPLVRNHLQSLYDTLLVQHLKRVVEPFSRVQVAHIAKLVNLDLHLVESKLSIMILDGQLKAVLDQSNGTLVVFEEEMFVDVKEVTKTSVMEKKEEVVSVHPLAKSDCRCPLREKQANMKHPPSDFLDSIDTFLLDCDGVIYHGNDLVPGVADVLQHLISVGKRLIFVSNNSTKSRQAYLKKFHALGLNFVQLDDVFSSAYAAAFYIKRHGYKKVFAIGEQGVLDELQELSVNAVLCDDEHFKVYDDFQNIRPDPSVDAVLIGADFNFTYKKLAQGHAHIKYVPGCQYFATNQDTAYPMGEFAFPGTGCVVDAMSTAVGRQPDCVFGKPHETMMQCIQEKYELDMSRTCMVGDRFDTDIQFGINGGCKTLLVLTGIASKEELSESKIQPTYYLDSFADLK